MNNCDMHITPFFSDFHAVTTLDLNLLQLQNYVEKVRIEDEGRIMSNCGGYQSKDIHDNIFDNEHIIDLFSKVNQCVYEISRIMGIRKNKLELSNFWININSKKDYNLPHTHFGGIISGVFYIKVPENSGDLIFINRNDEIVKSYLTFSNLIGGIDYDYTQFTSELWKIQPKENNLILFPSWLEHYVQSNSSDEDRISISFNYRIHP
jgi:uncharacterized protein (TIGR02466 family)